MCVGVACRVRAVTCAPILSSSVWSIFRSSASLSLRLASSVPMLCTSLGHRRTTSVALNAWLAPCSCCSAEAFSESTLMFLQ